MSKTCIIDITVNATDGCSAFPKIYLTADVVIGAQSGMRIKTIDNEKLRGLVSDAVEQSVTLGKGDGK